MKQVILVVIAVVVGVGIALAAFQVVGPHVPAPERAAQRLTSRDANQRAGAIAKWSEATGTSATPKLFTDFDTMDALRAHLGDAPDDAIRALGDAFADTPQWLEQFPDAHQRYLLILAGADRASGVKALHQIHRYDPKADLPRIAPVLEALTKNPDPEVRLRALEHAAYYLGRNEEPMVVALLDDPDPEVARTAWLHLALIDPESGHTGKWRQAPARVAYAMLYSAAFSNPQQIQTLLDGLAKDPDTSAMLGDTPFIYRYIAEGHPAEAFTPGETMDDKVRSLAQDSRRALWLLKGQNLDLLVFPDAQTKKPTP